MHKTLMLALGGGLLAAAALQVPGAALAAQKGSERSYGFIKPGERGMMSPMAKHKSKGLGGPDTATTRGQSGAKATSTCYTPPVRRGYKTPMSALPPPGLCLGQQVKVGGVLYCYNCGLSTQVAGGCVSCKTGYTWKAASESCCTGAAPALPPPK